MFGGGNNRINFVSVHDVATIVDQAGTDSSVRGHTLQVAGPDNVTMNELVAAVQTAAGRVSSPRHVPRQALRLVTGTVSRAQPALGVQFLAAVAMDTLDLTAGPSDSPETYLRPSLTTAMCLADANAPQDAW